MKIYIIELLVVCIMHLSMLGNVKAQGEQNVYVRGASMQKFINEGDISVTKMKAMFGNGLGIIDYGPRGVAYTYRGVNKVTYLIQVNLDTADPFEANDKVAEITHIQALLNGVDFAELVTLWKKQANSKQKKKK